MTNKCYQKHKSRQVVRQRYHNLSEEEKTKDEKRYQHFTEEGKVKSICIIVKVIKIFLRNKRS